MNDLNEDPGSNKEVPNLSAQEPLEVTPTAFIFDFDGTSVDSFPLIAKGYKALGIEIGDKERFCTAWKLFKYLGFRNKKKSRRPLAFARHVKKIVDQRENLRRAVEEVYLSEGKLKPELAEFWKSLLAENHEIIILSRSALPNPKSTIRKVLLRSDLTSCEMKKIKIETVEPREKKTEKFKIIRAKVLRRVQQIVALGDEISDYRCMRKAKFTDAEIIMVSDGFDSRKKLEGKESANPLGSKVFVPPEVIVDGVKSMIESCSNKTRTTA